MNIFGCSHKKQSWPITPKRPIDRVNLRIAGYTYTVCLDCGEEIPYDLTPLYQDVQLKGETTDGKLATA